ncbi:MAG: hypothetical protein LBH20_04100 [Treponema sp.]|jgi:hypothetical protein|nr:hypothetical protein [Treponema sp.]
MKITADLTKRQLLVNGAVFSVSCRVRTVCDGTRGRDEVVRSIPDNLPYDPMPFPKGLWNITGVERQEDKGFDRSVYGPVKIRTDARQKVNVWELDADGDYRKESERQINDAGYLLHYSASGTTLGCIRLDSPADAETIAGVIQRLFEKGEAVQLEVV